MPENQLRLYIHFSAPMGLKGGLGYVHLLDEAGGEVRDPFLPLDAEFWNDDRTRYTVFFDPGRQKRGIRAERGDGPLARRRQAPTRWSSIARVARRQRLAAQGGVQARASRSVRLTSGRSTSKTWRIDAAARRHARPARRRRSPSRSITACCCARWRWPTAAAAASRATSAVEAHETRWLFTPAAAWRSGDYSLQALAMLEDLAGNRIGRAFEVDEFSRADESAGQEIVAVPFRVE